jgi:hypothetical protein
LCNVGDDCIIDGNPWQSHTFEDGVMKRDHVHVGNNCRIEENCLLLYGCDLKEGSVVYANSGVMKDEVLSHYNCYGGIPLIPLSGVVAGHTQPQPHVQKEKVRLIFSFFLFGWSWAVIPIHFPLSAGFKERHDCLNRWMNKPLRKIAWNLLYLSYA